MEAGDGFLLEIEQVALDPVSPPPHPFPEAWFKAFPDSLPRKTDLGTLNLGASGSHPLVLLSPGGG